MLAIFLIAAILDTLCDTFLPQNVSAILYVTKDETYGRNTASSQYFLQLVGYLGIPVIAWNADNSGLEQVSRIVQPPSPPFRVWFENRPALYFFNYTFISAYIIFFLFRIKDTVADLLSVLLNFIANYDSKNENILPYCL